MMKKPILISFLLSILILAGSYYYFFIMNPVVEETKLPAKQKIMIQGQITSFQRKTLTKVEVKDVKQKEEPKAVEQKKIEQKPQEIAKPKAEEKTKKEVKNIEKEKKEKVEAKKRKAKFYSIVYVSSTGEIEKIRDDVFNKGYHTVRVGKHGGKDAVIISPFTDKWEAEYVLKHLVQDTGIKNFKVVAIY
ncbi:MAG: hypothetical protein N2202_08645 [Proteobacteria bacterium]|nr:hypothetical protein [Pseudomonadota bacterium]